MTVIAYKEGIMASDSRSSDNGYIATRCQKIFRLPSGALLGTAGDNDDRGIRELLSKVKLPKMLPSRKELADTRIDFLGLLVLPRGHIFIVRIDRENWEGGFEWTGSLWEHKEPIAAIGTGDQYALGAMVAGRSAAQAVAIAIKFDTRCGPPVVAMPLKKLAKIAT